MSFRASPLRLSGSMASSLPWKGRVSRRGRLQDEYRSGDGLSENKYAKSNDDKCDDDDICVHVLSAFLKKRTRYYRMLGLYSWILKLLRPACEQRRSQNLNMKYKQYLMSSMRSCRYFLYLYYTVIKWLSKSFEEKVLRNLRAAMCIYNQLFYDVAAFATRETYESWRLFSGTVSAFCAADDKNSEYFLSSDEDETEDEFEDLEVVSETDLNAYVYEEEELDEQTLQLYSQIATNALTRLASYQIQSSRNNGCCSICLEQYRPGQFVRILGCGHPFHVDCVYRWCSLGHFTCPNCRANLLE